MPTSSIAFRCRNINRLTASTPPGEATHHVGHPSEAICLVAAPPLQAFGLWGAVDLAPALLQRLESRDRPLGWEAPWGNKLTALGVAANAHGAAEILWNDVVVHVLTQKRQCVAHASHPYLSNSALVQKVLEELPGSQERRWSPDEKQLPNNVGKEKASALHTGELHRCMELDVAHAKALQVVDENGASNRPVPSECILLHSSETAQAMHNVELHDVLPRKSSHDSWPVTPPNALQRHGLTLESMSEETPAQPPGLQASLVGLQVPMSQGAVDIVIFAVLDQLPHPLLGCQNNTLFGAKVSEQHLPRAVPVACIHKVLHEPSEFFQPLGFTRLELPQREFHRRQRTNGRVL
mmetsp:Transcript_61627/g.133420  ORF Transcript_61627/g.133420 Transcript_61627/m.133420 type:complete len:351 (-) Transcript_61627:401-1453(-)